MKRSIYERITDAIVVDLEQGVAPWVKPWNGSADPVPHNAATRRAYRSINHLLLGMRCYADGYRTNGWLTFRQAQERGGTVRRGEKGTTVVLFKPLDQDEASVSSFSKPRAVIRAFTVFNIDQTEGLDDLVPTADAPIPWDPHESAECVIDQSGADIRHQGFQAFYASSRDCVYLPERSSFPSADGYYATALHELSHWTGHKSRLNRDFSGRFGSEAYAVEELIAELSAAFLSAHCRIPGQLQHSNYIASWLKVLNSDKRAIFMAAAQAQKAADYLLKPMGQPEVSQRAA